MRRFRPPLRFTLKTFFVLVTVLCAYLGYALNWIRLRHEARNWVESRGVFIDQRSHEQYGNDPDFHPAPWSLRILGEAGVCWISVKQSVDRRDEFDLRQKVKELKSLFPEAHVRGSLQNSTEVTEEFIQ